MKRYRHINIVVLHRGRRGIHDEHTVEAPRSLIQALLVRVIPGLLLLVAFIPQHISLWNTFPVWYHLTFLLSLVPLTYLGGATRRQLA